MKDKNLNNGAGDYREEMEELARIFKEELDKAREESEETVETEETQEYEVEGYAVTMGESKPIEELTEDELCECCGERPRGTEKNPDSPFCSECEAILEKYPYDWKGAVAAILTVFVTIVAVISFATNVPIFSYMIEGEKAYNEHNLLSAFQKYNKALTHIDEEDDGKYLNLYEKRILLNYDLVDMDSVVSDAGKYFSDTAKKLPMYKDIAKIENQIIGMQTTVLVIQDVIGAYAEVTDRNYEEIMGKLDALTGKKIYVSGSAYHLEGEEGFTPTGKEEVYTCDDAWINMYKYSVVQYMGKDDKVIAEYLSKAAEGSDYLANLVNPLLGATYVGIGEYEKAEALAEKIRENNKESVDYYMVMSMLSRYRDKDYQKGIDTCISGLNMLAGIPDGDDYIPQMGYILSMQKTLNYIMLKDYKSAYASAKECYSYQAETYSISVQVRDMYAMLALETGDTETFKTLEDEIKEYGEEASGFSSDVKNYRDGKVALQELAMSGGYDLI